MRCKFHCITINFNRTQHGIYTIYNFIRDSINKLLTNNQSVHITYFTLTPWLAKHLYFKLKIKNWGVDGWMAVVKPVEGTASSHPKLNFQKLNLFHCDMLEHSVRLLLVEQPLLPNDNCFCCNVQNLKCHFRAFDNVWNFLSKKSLQQFQLKLV